MKICIVTDAWHPQINGVVTTLNTTAKVLREWQHEILLITPELFSTVPCPTYPEIRLSLVRKKTLAQKITAFAPDALHIATEGPLGWGVRSVCKKQGFSFSTSYHTKFPEYVRMRAPVPLFLTYWIMRHFHGAAARTMAAPTLIDELHGHGFKNLVPWSRGVDTSLFKPRTPSSQDTGMARPVFLYVGRVAVEKNLPAFLDLALPGTKYVIGDGPALQELQEKYPDVLFTGAKRGEELASLVASADVFVFPSRTDTFGVVLLEAMASGLPVAAYPVTGPKYLIKNGYNGWLDTNLHTAATKALAIAPENCIEFATSYSWQACTEQFLAHLVNTRTGEPLVS